MEFSDFTPPATEATVRCANSTAECMNLSDVHNYTDVLLQDADNELVRKASKILRNVCIPSCVIFGLIGNTLTLMVFSARNMKKYSSSTFLASLAFVDNVFLLNLTLFWIDAEFYNIFRFLMVCEMSMFVSYVTALLSVLFVIGFTTERFIAICFPLRSKLMCNVFREKIIVGVMVVAACLLYNHSFWTIKIIEIGPRYMCVMKPEMADYLQVITWVDTILTMVVPFISITFMNILVLKAAVTSQKKKQSSCNQNSTLIDKRRRTMRSISQMRVTRTLMAVSTTFIVLNLPSHVFRLYGLIYTTAHPETHFSVPVNVYFVQEILNFLYYSTFCCNFIIYSVSGRHFLSNLKAFLRCSSTNSAESMQILQNSRIRKATSSGRSTSTSV